MADRDTTSTPYKLSIDDRCYFVYPDGDAPVTIVADYTELRTKGSVDGFNERIYVNGIYIRGAFEWSATDPYANGDDGGIVIAATDGWWVRQFSNLKSDPVKLDWYQPVQDADVTSLLTMLAVTYPTILHIKLPDSVSQLTINEMVTSGHYELSLTGGAALKQHPAPTTNLWVVWQISDTTNITFDRVHFIGRYGEYGTIEEYPDDQIQGAFIEINGSVVVENLLLDADFIDTTSRGLSVQGSSPATYVEIKGTYANSGFFHSVAGRTQHLHIDATITDPDGNALKLWQATGSLYEKWHGGWLQNADKLTGILRLRYGGAQWFMAVVGDIGNSIADPFIFDATHTGYDPQGNYIGANVGGRQWHVGKLDGLSTGWPANKRFLKFVDDGFIASKRHTQYECSAESQGQLWQANDIHTQADVTGPSFVVGEFNVNDNEIKNQTITGSFNDLTIRAWESTVATATVTTFSLGEHSIYYAYNNTINSLTVRDTGYVAVRTGAHTFNNPVFQGAARDIIVIDSTFVDGVNDAVVLDINNLSAPAGSVIRHNSGSVPIVRIDGTPVTLPHTV